MVFSPRKCVICLQPDGLGQIQPSIILIIINWNLKRMIFFVRVEGFSSMRYFTSQGNKVYYLKKSHNEATPNVIVQNSFTSWPFSLAGKLSATLQCFRLLLALDVSQSHAHPSELQSVYITFLLSVGLHWMLPKRVTSYSNYTSTSIQGHFTRSFEKVMTRAERVSLLKAFTLALIT